MLPPKALSIRDPWATLVCQGIKVIENRSWMVRYRGPICIHRSGPGGAIIGTCDLVDILTYEKAWKKFPAHREFIFGAWCWVLDNAVAIEEVPMPGRVSLWTVPMSVRERR